MRQNSALRPWNTGGESPKQTRTLQDTSYAHKDTWAVAPRRENKSLGLEMPGGASARRKHQSWDFKDAGQGKNMSNRGKHVQSPQER